MRFSLCRTGKNKIVIFIVSALQYNYQLLYIFILLLCVNMCRLWDGDGCFNVILLYYVFTMKMPLAICCESHHCNVHCNGYALYFGYCKWANSNRLTTIEKTLSNNVESLCICVCVNVCKCTCMCVCMFEWFQWLHTSKWPYNKTINLKVILTKCVFHVTINQKRRTATAYDNNNQWCKETK